MSRSHDSTEAEEVLVGALLTLEDAVTYAVPKVAVDDFSSDTCRKVFVTISKMYDEGERIDPVLVGRKAKLHATVLHDLMAACPVPQNYVHYTKAVLDDAEARFMARAFQDAASMAMTGETGEAWATMEDVRERMARNSDESAFDASRLASVTLDVADAYAAGAKSVLGISTGWPSLDKVIGGLVPGNFIVVAARPGKGKSVFAANLLVNVARGGERSLLLSMEMSAQEVGMRLFCREAQVNWESLRDGRVVDAGRAMTTAAERLSRLPFTVIDTPHVNVGFIRSAIQAHGPRVVIVDYVQLMASAGRENRQEEVSAISRGLKLLARDTDTTIVALAQLNRNVEMRGEGSSPQLSDLRDSGALEQDPDIVAFLVPKGGPFVADLELNVAKNRNGVAKQVFLKWDKAHVDITDPAPVAPHTNGHRPLAPMTGV